MTSSTITATLTGIRYQNDNSFIIGNFLENHKKFSGLGNMLKPQEGMEYRLTGQWSTHSQYGKQFKFQHYTIMKPADEDGMFKYLVREVAWIGPTIAGNLIDLYGNKTLEVLRSDPEIVVAEIRGLTLSKAEEIQEQLIENENIEAALVELLSILSVPQMPYLIPMKLIDKYGSDAPDTLRSNPYLLTKFHGVGFNLADKVAMQRLKFDPNSEHRITAAIHYELKFYMNESGSTWMGWVNLVQAVYLLTSVVKEKIGMTLDFMTTSLVADLSEHEGFVAFGYVNGAEKLIAEKIKLL